MQVKNERLKIVYIIYRSKILLNIVLNKEYITGGKSKFFYRGSLTTTELCVPNIIVLQYPNSEMTQFTDDSIIFSEYILISDYCIL